MAHMRLTHPDYTFEALSADQALKNLSSLISRPEFFMPALSMVEAPSNATFTRQVENGTFCLWEIKDASQQVQGVLIYSFWTLLSSVFVHVPGESGFNVPLTKAALEAIVPAIFAKKPAENDVLVPVPHPEPNEAELMLATLGFEVIGTRPEFEAQMTSYWLQRSIWEAYFGAAKPAPVT